MKHTFRLLLFSLITLAGLAPLQAQWERIGWEGGSNPNILAQLGNTLYGVANYSVYKSIDWGKTWTIFSKGLPNNTIFYVNASFVIHNGFLLFDNTPAYRYSPGLFEPGFYYCKENDDAWTFKKVALTNGVMPHILFWSADTIVAYRGGGDPNIDNLDGLYFSGDNGNSWQKRIGDIHLNLYHSAKAIGSHFIIDINGSKFFGTQDFGLTWKQLDLGNGDTSTINLYSIRDSILIIHSFGNNSTSGKIFRSIDFGATHTYIDQYTPELSEIANINVLRNVGKKTIMLTDNGADIYKEFLSDDFGEHWRRIQSLDSTTWVSDVYGKDNYYIIYVVGPPSSTLKRGLYSMDSSFNSFIPFYPKGALANWRTLLHVFGKKLFVLTDNGDQYPGLYYDSLLLSNDNGMTWTQSKFFEQNKLERSRWVQDGGNLYASGIQIDTLPCIFKSTDEGNTWIIATKFSTKDVISKFFVSGDTMVVLQNKDLLISIDAGRSWVVESNILIDPVTDISYSKGVIINPSISGYNRPYVYFSTDLGFTWNIKSISSDFLINAYGSYIFDNSWFAAFGNSSNDFSLYYQKARDTNWKKCKGLDSSLLPVPTCDEDGILYATGSWVNGNAPKVGHTALFYSLDSGANWKQLGDYVTNSPDVFIGSDYIFLAGPTELWRGPKPTIPSSVASTKNISSISIGDCYPNPAASEMRISYSISKRSDVVLSVFDITGKEITTIATETHDAGSYEKLWNVNSLSNGSYILKLTACGESVTKVVEVVK